tara:strand:+ start:2925 stop:3161 length:237 start_codon:yes stop_codon:yes gene_type:complete
MGFNKRLVTEERVMDSFNENGVQGIMEYLGNAEALYVKGEKTQKIIDVVNQNICDTIKNIKIKNIIEEWQIKETQKFG